MAWKLGRSRDGSKVIVSDARTRTLAQFYGSDRDTNGLLFMAATDLLQACEQAQGMIGDMLMAKASGSARPGVDEPYARDVDNALRAAIAKSRGRS